MTHEEIIDSQSIPDSIDGVFADLFNKLIAEYDGLKDKICKEATALNAFDLSIINAFDKYAEEYSSSTVVLCVYSLLVTSCIINENNIEYLMKDSNLLHDLTHQYENNRVLVAEDEDVEGFWKGIVDNVVENIQEKTFEKESL